MIARRVVQIALLAVVAATLVIVLRPQRQGALVPAPTVAGDADSTVTYAAYYFHGERRCDTCRSIEAQAEAAVRGAFADELAAGTLTWQAVNTDRSDDAHFNEDFGLTHSTLVLVEREGTRTRRFMKLDRVWELVHDEGEFRGYVQGEIGTWLRPGS